MMFVPLMTARAGSCTVEGGRFETWRPALTKLGDDDDDDDDIYTLHIWA